jgi:polyisoprenoid-binding protein YceI
MRMRITRLGALFALATVVISAPAWAEKFEAQVGEGSEVVFDSHAPMEKFQGKTDQISGWLEADLTDLTQPVTMEIQVDLASFDTGKGKRNKHMRENHLETEKFPLAVFKGGTLSEMSATSFAVGDMVEFDLTGTLSLHGVDREMTCHVKLSQPESSDLQVEAKFDVMLPDFSIKRPKFLIVKLAEDQKVTATLVMKKES